MFPTCKEFSQFNDWCRLKMNKHHNPKWLKIVYYPFALAGLCLACCALYMLTVMIIDSARKSYRYSNKYRKVIKKGILWDSVEYHER